MLVIDDRIIVSFHCDRIGSGNRTAHYFRGFQGIFDFEFIWQPPGIRLCKWQIVLDTKQIGNIDRDKPE